MYDNNWMGFSQSIVIDGIKEAAEELPAIPVASGVRKIVEKSREVLATFGKQDESDCTSQELLASELIGNNNVGLSPESPC